MDAVGWGRPGGWFPDPQRGWGADWYDLRDGCLTVKDRDGFPPPHDSKVLAELGFQFRNSHLSHDYMITRNSHFDKAVKDCKRARAWDPAIAGASAWAGLAQGPYRYSPL